MSDAQPEAFLYKRARFEAALPRSYRYTSNHFWCAESDVEPGAFRVGLTKFGSRLLGEIVDFGFDVAIGSEIASGQKLGWVEGFKAVTELASLADGEFLKPNAALEKNPGLINQDPHFNGWLYLIRAKNGPGLLDCIGYAAVLDREIDAWLARSET